MVGGLDRGIAGSAALAGVRYFWIVIEPNKMMMSIFYVLGMKSLILEASDS